MLRSDLWYLSSQVLILLRILEEIDKLQNLHLGLLTTSHMPRAKVNITSRQREVDLRELSLDIGLLVDELSS